MTKWTDDERVTIAYKDNWNIQVAIIYNEIFHGSSLIAVKIFKGEQEALDFIHAELYKWAKKRKFTEELPEFKSLAFMHPVGPKHGEYDFNIAIDKATLETKKLPDDQGGYWNWGEFYREKWLALSDDIFYKEPPEDKFDPENIAGLEREAESLG